MRDNAGQYACGCQGSIYLWNGSSFVKSSNAHLSGGYLDGETESGLMVGYNSAGWAYDLNTSAYYSIGPTNTWPLGGNAAGYLVGQDGGGTEASSGRNPISPTA